MSRAPQRQVRSMSATGGLALSCPMPVVETEASFFLGLLIAYCICQTFTFVSGLLSLQRLRSHYLVIEAQRRASEKAIVSAGQPGTDPFRAPEGYGEVFRPH
jgi:hypothetical protein